jgi:hypothetical protein
MIDTLIILLVCSSLFVLIFASFCLFKQCKKKRDSHNDIDITEIHQICNNQVRKVNTETINSPTIKNIVKSFNKNSSWTNISLQGRVRSSIKEKNMNNSNIINSFSKKLKILQNNSCQSIGKDSITEFKSKLFDKM